MCGENMTFNSMDYFVVLARERSFTKAAEQLHITQQSLSSHIASLEEELGCKLFVRRVPLELTYAGTVFLRYANEFQQRTNAMRQEFCDITKNQKGVLRIGIAITRGRAIMPELIERFQGKYPNIVVELCEAPNDVLHKNLLNGDNDLAVANFPENLQGIELREFYEEEVGLFLARDLAKTLYRDWWEYVIEDAVQGDLGGLESCPFVMGNSADIAANIGQAVIRKANINPTVKVRSGNMETLLSLCVRGVGACFCPRNLAQATLSKEQMESLVFIPLGEQGKYQIRFGYQSRSYQWNIIAEFIEMALGNGDGDKEDGIK